ncbi:MAG: DUF3341 domain-containing protein [Desulfobacteraceae bacterium]|nr:MAG: DUF3341 domain-containing protein [Desulfobacteraceae bacterium]
MQENKKLLAIYAYVDDVIQAIEKMKAEKIAVENVYTPARNDEVEEALGMRPSPVRRFVLFGGLFGVISGFVLATYTAAQWKFIVWGKPQIPRIPYVVISFEFCILFAILAGLAGLLILSRMPRLSTPAHYDARFTVDRFGILLTCPPARNEAVRRLLHESGAEEIRDV